MPVDISGGIPWFLFVKGTSFQTVTKFIIKYGNTFHFSYILLYSPLLER